MKFKSAAKLLLSIWVVFPILIADPDRSQGQEPVSSSSEVEANEVRWPPSDRRDQVPEYPREDIPLYLEDSSIPGLKPATAAAIESGLGAMGIAPYELGFHKLAAREDTFRLAFVEDIMNDPLSLPLAQTRLVQGARDRARQSRSLLGFLGGLLAVEAGDGYDNEIVDGPDDRPDDAVRGTARAIDESVANAGADVRRNSAWGAAVDSSPQLRRADPETVLQHWTEAATKLEAALAEVPKDLREEILIGAPSIWGNEDDEEDALRKGMIHFELGARVDTTLELGIDPVLDAAASVRRAEMLRAAEHFLLGMEEAQKLGVFLRAETRKGRRPDGVPNKHPKTFRSLEESIRGDVVAAWPSEFGWFVVGGETDNVYDPAALKEIALLLDLGGNDVYRGRVASGLGGSVDRPLGGLIDFDGDDTYLSGGSPYAQGGAVMGCAALVDLNGDDLYRADDGSLGAGYFGFGLLYDGAGRDRFEGRNFTQGAGAVGIGMLIASAAQEAPGGPEIVRDVAYEEGILSTPGTGSLPIRFDENDTYEASFYGQGFASTLGIGLLYDDQGNDLYRAGGRYPHAPLLPHDFRSLSQGFSIGFRPRASGGIGLLIDEAGNDYYDAEVYAQGAAYFYSFGLLFDGGGNDRYLASQYGQGAGIHLAAGSLWDRGGDDHYVSKHGVVQGTAHDYAVAMLLDESGNDMYTVRGGQGESLTNSSALFIDEMGDDIYATAGAGQGTARYRRGFSGAALFLDLEGSDTYPEKGHGADGLTWSTHNFSIGMDLDRDIKLPTEDRPEIILTAEDSTRAIDELYETASLWEVGSSANKVRRARIALSARGEEAVAFLSGETGPYPDGEPLAQKTTIRYRTLREVAGKHPDLITPRLLARMDDEDLVVRGNIIRLLGDLKRAEAEPEIRSILADAESERLHGIAVWALGRIGQPASIPAVRDFVRHDKESLRIRSLEALKLLGDEESAPVLVEMMSDPYFTVRSAAMSGLVHFGRTSVPAIVDAADATDDPIQLMRGLGLVRASLKDSTSTRDVAARDLAESALLKELERALEDWQERGAGDSAGEVGKVNTSAEEAKVAVCAQALLRLPDAEIHRKVRRQLEGRDGPMIRSMLDRYPMPE